MLNDKELFRIQEAAAGFKTEISISVGHGYNPNPFSENLSHIAAQISGVTMGKVRTTGQENSVFPDKASLTIHNARQSNIHYYAAPEGPELQPFIEALSSLAAESTGVLPGRASETVGSLLLFIASGCPHCPQAVRIALSVAIEAPGVSLIIVDALEFQDVADRYKIKSTPTLVVNDGFTVVGGFSRDDLFYRLQPVDTDEKLTAVLSSMINNGRAEDAAGLTASAGMPKALLPIFTAPEFSLRMGALVTMEEALAINPRALDDIVDDLTVLLAHDEAALRGDTAQLLGNIGHPGALSRLREAMKDPDEDVAEAAVEAVEALEAKLV